MTDYESRTGEIVGQNMTHKTKNKIRGTYGLIQRLFKGNPTEYRL